MQAINTGTHAQYLNGTSTQLLSLHPLLHLGLSHLLEKLTLHFFLPYKVLTKVSHLHKPSSTLLN